MNLVIAAPGEHESSEYCSDTSYAISSVLIEQLHRHDSYVSFAVKSDDDFRPRYSIRAPQIKTLLPKFETRLSKDSYVSLNASSSAHESKSEWSSPNHNSRTLSHLCACYCDIDYYKLGLDFAGAYSTVIRMQDAGTIPPASIVIRGRGMWLLWLLHDPHNPEQAAPIVTPVDKLLYSRIQRELVRRLAPIGADAAGVDPTRYVRIPGSLHTSQETAVDWLIAGSSQTGAAFAYTLSELAGLLGIQTQSVLVQSGSFRRLSARSVPRRAKGYVCRYRYRLSDLCQLQALRDGFRMGCRASAALVYADTLFRLRVSEDVVRSRVLEFGSACKPPLKPAECRNACNSVRKRRLNSGQVPSYISFSNQTISDLLGITPDEALSLKKLGPASQYFGAIPKAASPISRKQITGLRLNYIREIIQHTARIPTCREMADILLARKDLRAGYVTIARDYKRLGLVAPGNRGKALPI